MSEHVRFTALAATFFVLSYTGVAWVMAGSPMPRLSVPSAEPDTRLAALPSAPSQTSQQPVQLRTGGDRNPQRDNLRLAALRASNAYAAAPCDGSTKVAMVEAVSSYAKAWHDMMGCGPDGCDYKKLNATAAAFSTPLDIQVRDAIGLAFDQRGISVEDFPAPLRINVAMLVRGRGAPATACPETQVRIGR